MRTPVEIDDRADKPGPRPCSMREACIRAGLDGDGGRCPSCPLRELCGSELRWLIQVARKPLYPN